MDKVNFHTVSNCKLLRLEAETNPKFDIANFRTKRLILVGNGAVKNGWDPIAASFKRFKPPVLTSRIDLEKYVNNEKLLEGLTVLAHLRRLFRAQYVAQKLSGKETELTFKLLSDLNELNNVISEDFLSFAFEKKISFTKEKYLIDKILENRQEFFNTLIMTLNWDPLLWDDNLVGNLAYLHGNAYSPESLFYPSHLLSENEEFISINKNLRQAFTEEELNILVKGDKDKILLSLAQLFVNVFSEAEEMILWGVGLNAYDADIITVLAVVPHANLKHIKIINRSNQEKQIKGLLKTYLPTYEGKVEFIPVD